MKMKQVNACVIRNGLAASGFVAIVMLSGSCEKVKELATSVTTSLGGDSQDVQYVESAFNFASAAAKALEELTPEQEHYIGRAVAANLIDKYGVYENPAATRFVNLVGHGLALNSDKAETFGGWQFVILDSDEINGFAAPGGIVMVTRGLLATCQTEDALASVLAHEIAHVQLRHGYKVIQKSRNSEMWLTGVQEANKSFGTRDTAVMMQAFSPLVDDLVNNLIVGGYGQDAEFEADKTAVELLNRVGYDPNGLTDMLSQMETRWTPGEGFGRTHPEPKKRLDKVKKQVPAQRLADVVMRQQRFEEAMGAILPPRQVPLGG